MTYTAVVPQTLPTVQERSQTISLKNEAGLTVERKIADCIQIGENAYSAGQYTQAEHALRQAFEAQAKDQHTYPAMAIALENLALVYVQKRRYGKAERVLKRAIYLHEIGLKSKNSVPICRLTYRLAYAYLVQRKIAFTDELIQRAIEVGEKCVVRDREMEIGMLLRLANLMAEYGEHDRALELYKSAIELRTEPS